MRSGQTITPLLHSEPFADCLTTEAAEKITALRADDVIQQRIDELADLANQVALMQEEQSEYDRYLAAFQFVTPCRRELVVC